MHDGAGDNLRGRERPRDLHRGPEEDLRPQVGGDQEDQTGVKGSQTPVLQTIQQPDRMFGSFRDIKSSSNFELM